MLIQCHTCHTKYRLNLERIPNRKTFVKCKHCGTPIYIDEQSDVSVEPTRLTVEPAAPVPRPEPAPSAPAAVPEQAHVVCDACGTHYRVPQHKLQQPRVLLKCTHCGNTFAPPSAEPPAPLPAPDFYPPNEGEQPAAMDQVTPDMPLPDEERLDTMFDDLGEHVAAAGAPEPNLFESRSLAPDDLARDEGAFDADQAYLEATQIYDEAQVRPPLRGSVPDEQKYQLFMKPGGVASGAERRASPEPSAPAAAASDELPPLPGAEAAEAGPELPAAVGAEGPPLPPHATAAAFAAQPSAPTAPPHAMESDMPEIPDDLGLPAFPRKEQQAMSRRDRVPGQSDPPGLGEGRIIAMALAAVVVVAVVAGALAWQLFSTQGSGRAYDVKMGSEHALGLNAALHGRYIDNKASNVRLFVVDGELTNGFPDEEQIGWIRLRGDVLAHENDEQPMQEAFTYIGNVLTDQQLQQWDVTAIRAYYGYNNGRNDSNYRIPRNARIPFQFVFAGIDKPVARAVAEVVSYTRHDRPVFVQSER